MDLSDLPWPVLMCNNSLYGLRTPPNEKGKKISIVIVNAGALKAGKPITGKDSVSAPLVKQLSEAALEAEIDTHLAQEVAPNRKNGKSRKTMKSISGEFELETPRDRSGTFEPKLVKKNQTHVSDEIESKILSTYGRGMSYRDISGQVEELYGISISTATLTRILHQSDSGLFICN
jgi:transposase-like protein